MSTTSFVANKHAPSVQGCNQTAEKRPLIRKLDCFRSRTSHRPNAFFPAILNPHRFSKLFASSRDRKKRFCWTPVWGPKTLEPAPPQRAFPELRWETLSKETSKQKALLWRTADLRTRNCHVPNGVESSLSSAYNHSTSQPNTRPLLPKCPSSLSKKRPPVSSIWPYRPNG